MFFYIITHFFNVGYPIFFCFIACARTGPGPYRARAISVSYDYAISKRALARLKILTVLTVSELGLCLSII